MTPQEIAKKTMEAMAIHEFSYDRNTVEYTVSLASAFEQVFGPDCPFGHLCHLTAAVAWNDLHYWCNDQGVVALDKPV